MVCSSFMGLTPLPSVWGLWGGQFSAHSGPSFDRYFWYILGILSAILEFLSTFLVCGTIIAGN